MKGQVNRKRNPGRTSQRGPDLPCKIHVAVRVTSATRVGCAGEKVFCVPPTKSCEHQVRQIKRATAVPREGDEERRSGRRTVEKGHWVQDKG